MISQKQIEDILKDYHWMINSIKILNSSLQDAGEGLTAQYGLESSLPKAKGTNGDPVFREAVRREKRFSVIDKYRYKVSIIQDRIPLITDERETEVLHWLLEGKSYRWIGMHMGLSDRHIRRIRDSIVEKMSDMSHLSKTS
ncbi:LuxR C-terminal-related transcriptional regulator [Bacillus massiliigorillae]|uniref:LuxR C-terminal-related transcriptional regulator n=1 Tax=Bacillus massiliigorillae TaxID=1243664 RepID=UPI0003A4D40A|nr:LuxR C-terminal-related transcriptional regulator [Bacillus massiliigorillae]